MSEQAKTEQAQEKSFLALLAEYSIRIPIIQRDYAQGRKTNAIERIRNSFLDSIAKAIQTVQADRTAPPLSLDFIYGTIAEDGYLEPIDGQQRLTTLFLLHWYYAAKDGLHDYSAGLNRFTYSTRTSSSEFCAALSLHPDVYKKASDFGNSVTTAIADASWFMLLWQDDPTVAAMLTMLDTIHHHPILGSLENVYPLLESNPPVVFQFLPIEKFGKGEDLYIKMNSRGKRLTEFELFKALFGKHLSQDSAFIDLAASYWNNIDGSWSRGFWDFLSKRYAQKKTPPEQYCYQTDGSMMRYIWLQFEMLGSKDDVSQKISSPFYSGNSVQFNYESARECLLNNPEISGIKTEQFLLDSWAISARLLPMLDTIFGNEPPALTLWDTDCITDVFLPMETVVNGEKTLDPKPFTFFQKILVFSALTWCVKNGRVPTEDTDIKRLQGYLRVIRNALIRARSIRTTKAGEYTPNLRYDTIGNFIRFITEHLFCDISQSAYEALTAVEDAVITDLFPHMTEEKQKAVCVRESPDLLQKYQHAEDFPMLKGTIAKLLNSQGSLVLPTEYLTEVFSSCLSGDGILLTRAILSSGESFHLPITYQRIRFGGKTANQWLVGFTYDNKNAKKALGDFAEAYKNVRDQFSDCNQTLCAIIDAFLSQNTPWFSADGREDWRYYFVQYESSLQMFDFSKSDMIHPLSEALRAQPIFIMDYLNPFECRTILNGVRRTKPHINTYTWIAAQDQRIAGFFDASASWQSGYGNCDAVFCKNGVSFTVSCTNDGFWVNGVEIRADNCGDRVENLIRYILSR